MTLSAVVFMILSIVLLWGGLAASALYLRRLLRERAEQEGTRSGEDTSYR